MPYTVLVFDSVTEQEELSLAQNGPRYSIVIEELRNWLRSEYKYKDRVEVTIEEVRMKINELMDE